MLKSEKLFHKLVKLQETGDFNGCEISFAIETEDAEGYTELSDITLNTFSELGQHIEITYFENGDEKFQSFRGSEAESEAAAWLNALRYYIKELSDFNVGEGLF